MSHAKPNPPTTRSAGKSAKAAGGTKIAAPMSRRDKLASFEAARKKEPRNRTIRLLVICVVLAMALLAYPVYLFVDDYRARNADLAIIGVELAAAGCDQVAEHPASGNQDHVEDGTKVAYTEFPPAFGQHYPEPAPFDRKFYTMADRPPVETARAQPGARLHRRLVPRRCAEQRRPTRWSGSPRPSPARTTTRTTSSSRRRGRTATADRSRTARTWC